MPRPIDTDYLHLSTRLKAMERNMLTQDKLVRIIAARTGEDAVKILGENGWNSFTPTDINSLEGEISRQRKEAFDLICQYAPDTALANVFRLKYDYHNLKVITKTVAQNIGTGTMLSEAGTIPSEKLVSFLHEGELNQLHPIMQKAAVEAADLLARTSDPQLSDLLLDKAHNDHCLAVAKQTESDFLINYFKLNTDLINLRVLTRASRAKKGFEYISRAIFEGGNVNCSGMREITAESIKSLFGFGVLIPAADAAAEAVAGAVTLSKLDLVCDNILIDYIRSSKLIPFGDATVISYILAMEAQFVAVRTVMSGRASGVSDEQITERLRNAYV